MVCGSVIVMSPTNTAEPVEMPFGLWASMGSRNRILDGGPDPSMGSGNIEERKVGPFIVRYRDTVR